MAIPPRARWPSVAVAVPWSLLVLSPARPVLSVTLRGQTVEGVVRSEPGGQPLAGAHILLVLPGADPVAQTLSGTDGTFRLASPTPGRYLVRAEALTHTGTVAAVSTEDGPHRLTLTLQARPPDTDLPSVRADRQCRVGLEERSRIAALWDEAAKALRVAEWTRSTGAVELQTETWYRRLEPRRLRVQEEARTPRPGFHATGYVPSPPASELAAQGFIWGGAPGEALSFHGPDATTLVDPGFLASHCLGFDPDGPSEGWVGLTFASREPDTRDVEGTLWIDAASGAPRRLEYRYTDLPWPIKTEKVGGGMDLEALSGGAWIVRRWWIRMPRVAVREERITQWDAPRRRYALEAVVEEGGQVTCVRFPDGSTQTLEPLEP